MKMDLSKEKKGEKYEWYLGGKGPHHIRVSV